MTLDLAEARLAAAITDYARLRERAVSRGAETPLLAAVLLDEYGRGVTDSITLVLDTAEARKVTVKLQRLLDDATRRIDPAFDRHRQERVKGKPADLLLAPAVPPAHGDAANTHPVPEQNFDDDAEAHSRSAH
jgi:hypothetical protein